MFFSGDFTSKSDLHSFPSMDAALTTHFDSFSTDRRKLFRAVFGLLAVVATVASALFFRDKYMYGALVLATPLALVVVSSPRLAIYQFAFFLFIKLPLSSEIHVTLMDISAALLVAAGFIDFFLNQRKAISIPLALPFSLLIGALFIAGLNAYDTSLALTHPAKSGFLFVVFLSLVWLYRHIKLERLLKVFLWIGVAHATLALAVYLTSGGAIRSFALAPKALDDILMLSLPLATFFALKAPRKSSLVYSIGAALTLGGLVATQSRAPIAFGILGAALTFIIAYRHIRSEIPRRKLLGDSATIRVLAFFRRRIRKVVVATGLITIALFGLNSELFLTVGERFSELLTTNPGGTFRLRLTLWKAALLAFQDNPWLGVGPSNFRLLDVIYTSFRLDPAHLWVQGLSAHSLLLHYLAETGIIGATALMALMVRQFYLARKNWLRDKLSDSSNASLGLYAVSIIILLTTIAESAWTWGHVSFVAVFFLAAISRSAQEPASERSQRQLKERRQLKEQLR
jgi:O-antigen ligase